MAAKNTAAFNDKSSMTVWKDETMKVYGEYSFAVDGGATTDTYKLFTLPVGYVIVNGALVVTASCTSGGSATVEAGYTGSTAALFAQTAVATLADGYALGIVARQEVTSNNIMFVTIGTAALTAGKISFWVELKKAY